MLTLSLALLISLLLLALVIYLNDEARSRHTALATDLYTRVSALTERIEAIPVYDPVVVGRIISDTRHRCSSNLTIADTRIDTLHRRMDLLEQAAKPRLAKKAPKK